MRAWRAIASLRRNDPRITWRKGRWIHMCEAYSYLNYPFRCFSRTRQITGCSEAKKDVIESLFLSAPTFEAVLWKRLTYKITSTPELVREISQRLSTTIYDIFARIERVIHPHGIVNKLDNCLASQHEGKVWWNTASIYESHIIITIIKYSLEEICESLIK